MSNAQLEIVFVDSGDQIPAQPTEQAAPPPKPRQDKPQESGKPSPSNEPPPPTTGSGPEIVGPKRTERTTVPGRDEAEKGTKEFFDTLKESGQKLADVAGLGPLYSQVAQLLGGLDGFFKAINGNGRQNGTVSPSNARRTEQPLPTSTKAEQANKPTPQPATDSNAVNQVANTIRDFFGELQDFLKKTYNSLDISSIGKRVSDLFSSIGKFAERFGKKPEADKKDIPEAKTRPTSERTTAPDDVLDAEFTVVRSATQTTPPRGNQPSLPGNGQMIPRAASSTASAPRLPAPPLTPATTGPAAAGTTAMTTAAPATTATLAPAAGGLIASLGPAALAVAGLTAAVVAGAVVMKSAFDAMKEQVDLLEGYSVDVANVAAINELRQEMANMRRADRIGRDLAKADNTVGKVQEKMADLQTEMYAVLLQIFNRLEPLVDMAGKQVDNATVAVKLIAGIGDLMLRFQKQDYFGAGQDAIKILKDIFGFIQSRADDDPSKESIDDPFMAQWMALAEPGTPRHPSANGRGNNNGRPPAAPPAGRGKGGL